MALSSAAMNLSVRMTGRITFRQRTVPSRHDKGPVSMANAGHLGRVLRYCALLVLAVSCHSPLSAAAHSANDLQELFERGPIPKELLEATRELDATAGMKSSREEAHARQHELLDAYLRAAAERKCREAGEAIGLLDTAIVASRDAGKTEEEQTLRVRRDEQASFLQDECVQAAPGTLLVPKH